MDFLNRDKVRRLESENKDRDDVIFRLEKRADETEREIRGERVCNECCSVCGHGIKKVSYYPYIGSCENYICELDCKCKDFRRKTNANE